jgi:hypothetical protein
MKKRTAVSAFIYMVLLAWVCACGESSSNITVQIAPGTDLCAYETYNFYETEFPEDPEDGSSSNLAQIDQVVKSTMTAYFALLGMTADTEDPDLMINTLYATGETSTPIQNCEKTPEGEWYGYYPDGYDCKWVTEWVTVTKGSVMIDMIDTATGGLVFRATADGITAGSVTVNNIEEGLREVFSYWPKDCGL